uniref:Transmembrane protein 31 n=1 Tax=Propithecus coquereli TaxID=379532 RepID=A0A2K6GRS6_PROCO
MGLTDKSVGEQQLKPNNSDAPNEDQREEVQQQEERTPVGQRTQRAGTQPSRCQLPSRTTPRTSINRRVNFPGILPWPMQWVSSPYQLPDVLQFYPELLLVFKEAFHDMAHCLKAHIEEIGLPILLQLSALSNFYFYLPVLPILLFLYFFTLFVLLLLLLIILFILIFS